MKYRFYFGRREYKKLALELIKLMERLRQSRAENGTRNRIKIMRF